MAEAMGRRPAAGDGGSSLPPAAARALQLSAFARAFAEVVLFAYFPLHVYVVLGEQRMTLLSLILAVPSLVRFATAGLWGMAVDRTGRYRPFLVLGLVAYALSLSLLNFIRHPLWAIATVCILAAPASAYTPTARGYLTLWPASAPQALGAWLRSESAGWLVGGLTMSLVAGGHGQALPLLAAVLVAASLVPVALFLAEPRAGAAAAAPGAVSPAPPAAPTLSPVVGRVALFVGLASAGAEAVFAVFGIYLTQILHGPVWLYGAALTGSTVTGLVAYGPATRLASAGKASLLLRLAAAGYLTYYSLLLIPNPWVAAVAFTLPMYPLVRTAATLLVAGGSSKAARGRAMGFLDAVEGLAVAAGSFLGGVVADLFSIPTVLAVGIVLAAVLIPVAARVARTGGEVPPAGAL